MRISQLVSTLLVVWAAAIATPALAAPGEVQNVQWCTGSNTCLQWNTEPAAASYRVYRGERSSFPCLLTPSVESCDEGSFVTTTTSGTISDVPPAGSLFWFIVTASNGTGEGSPGAATPGPRQQNVSGACINSCALSGSSCSVDADCCSTNCVGGTCQAACCQPTAGFCFTSSDCCSGACSAGQCLGPCSIASECPGNDTFCQARSCNAGVCGFSNTPAGTPTGSQFPGDCQTSVCDGTGGVTSVVDNNDVPVDGNQCTGDQCNGGVPSNPAAPLNSPCSQNGGVVCNGIGMCVQCNSASQCPGIDTECRQRTCSANACGITFTAGGTVTNSQNPGDCHTNACDGAGNIANNVDNNDVPVDGNQCTGDACNGGVPSNPPAPLNSPCSQNGGNVCNGSGMCVQCNSASQCPGIDTECRQRTCSANTCGVTFTPAGTVTGSQNPGDCHTNACDGAGNITNNVDNADVPVDGNQCTGDVCLSGNPSNPPSSSGTACNQNGGTACDGAGSCVVPPQVVSTSPADGASSPAGTSISVTFSQAMNPATLSGQTVAGACSGSIQLSLDNFASCVAFSSASASMSGGNTIATFVPLPGLLVNRTYKIRVTTSAQNTISVALVATYTHATGFTTTSPNLCDGSLVISQIYGSSSSTGAVYKSDFIELHNRGTSAISLAGMSVQYASATGTTWLNQTSLSGSIPAGGYFLIQEFTVGSGGALPTPDATGTIDMSGSTGKLALVASTTPLSGACPTGGAIVDFLGYGSTANCNEGGSNAPSPSATTSLARQQGGCLDLNLNGTDFTSGAATPRNSAAAPNVCACVARNESTTGAEADFCTITFPLSLTVQTGISTGSVFGQIYEAGITDPAGPPAIVRAQLGFGPPTANPEYQPGWTWTNASYNTQDGDNDEYQASFIAPAAGSYRYVYRFSVDQGLSWTYCDNTQVDGGAGSNAGLTFDLENESVLNVTP